MHEEIPFLLLKIKNRSLRYFIYRLSEADYSRFSVAATALFLLTLSFASYPEAFSQTISNDNNVSNESNSRSNNNRSDSAEHLVTIPRGAGNPTPDLTLQNVGKWYEPKALAISQGDTVIWKNDDTEPHSVTSGIGGGLISAQTGSRGKPDGIFDSGLFQPGKSWSYKFNNAGTFAYFCTIHPWMEGVVIVQPVANTIKVPIYPVDGQGNKQQEWPVHTFSKDGKYDIDLSWSPKVIHTGDAATFFADFFDARTNARLQIVPYDFIVMQNGKELDNVHSLTQIGSGVQKYVFSKAGPITIKIAGVGESKDSYSEFSTIIYPSSSDANRTTTTASSDDQVIKRLEGGSPPVSRFINAATIVYFTYGVIFVLPAAAAAIVILYKKGII